MIKTLLMSLCLFLSMISLSHAEVVDLSPYQTPAKDQKNSDKCAFYAITGLIESVVKAAFKTEIDVSEDFEWRRSKVIKGQRPEVEFGNTAELAKNIIDDFYVMTEDQKKVEFRSLKTNVLTQMWARRSWSELMMAELRLKRSVVVTVRVAIPYIDDSGGYLNYTPSIDQECQQGTISCGGHAILLTGFDSERKVFFFKNSWGESWGHHGYGTVTFEQIDRFSEQPVVIYFDSILGPWVRFE